MSRSKVELDIQVIHCEDIGDVVGYFYGTPIRTWNASASQARENADVRRRIAYAKEANSVPTQN
jgi:hypothetical protein